MSIRRYTGSVGRFVVICLILARQVLVHLPLRARITVVHRRREIDRYLKTRRRRLRGPELLKETLERLGPTFIKLGQFLSIRPDLVSAEYCNEFRKLQDHVPPIPVAQVHRVIEEELGGDPARIFSEFDEVPVAAASVAQVHRARLHCGVEVAVKVQRPRVREEMEEDILIMLFFARVLDRLVPALRKNQLAMIIHEFSRWTDRELDFRQEGRNALQFAAHFAGRADVTFPGVHLDYTTERLLVMEFIRGRNLLDAAPGSFDRDAVVRLIAGSMLQQIFVHGFFHADPHTGNIMLLGSDRIAYIDFGIVGYLSEELREWTFDILYGMAKCDTTRIIESFLELCDVDAERVNLRAYRRRMNEILSELRICQVANIPFTHLLERFLDTSLEFGIDIPHDFVIMSKAIATLEGTCLSLDPDLRIADFLQPFVNTYATTVPDLDTALERLRAGPFEVRRLERLAVRHGVRLLRMLERPTFRIEGREFRNIVREVEKSSLNVTYGLLIAALIVFSATVSNESGFELWLKSTFHLPIVPILSIGSLVVAAYLWLRLFLGNRRGAKEYDQKR
jgi:ubiquinone biosynthesis protein